MTANRAYSGDCDHCGRDINTVIEVSDGQLSKPGVLMRCAGCQEVSFVPAASAGDHRADPPWYVAPDEVLEWFHCGTGKGGWGR
jgi:hypothetical protein